MSRKLFGFGALVTFGALAAVVACGDAPTETIVASCTPGRSLACAGPGGCKGFQVCRSDGTFDECACPDATVLADGDVPDGDDPIDGGRRDASRDGPIDVAEEDAPIDVAEEDAPPDVADVFVPPSGWGVAFGNSPSGNMVAVAVDGNKNIVAGGWGGAGSLTKLAPNGVAIYQKSFADVIDLALNPNDGSIVVVGTAAPNTDFGGGVVPTSGMFVAKYDTNGVYQWLRGPFGATVSLRKVAVRSNGNAVVVGTLDAAVDLGSGTLTPSGYPDALLFELTPAGTLVRAKRWGDVGRQGLDSIAFDANGNVVVTGTAESSVDFGGGPITGPAAGSGLRNVFLVKLDANAAFLAQRATGTNATDFLSVYGTDSVGRLLVAGSLQSKMNFGAADLFPNTTADIIIAALDSSLTQVWAKQFGQVAGPLITGLAANPAGGFTAVGWSTNALSFGLGGLPAQQFPFFVRFDANGNPVANFAATGTVGPPTGVAWLTGNDFVVTGQCGPGQVVFPWGSMKCLGQYSAGYVTRFTQ
jgi:hypothetical protein